MNEEQYLKIEGWLKSIDNRLSNIESAIPAKGSFNSTDNANQNTGVEKLAHVLQITIDEIYNIISFEGEDNFTFLFEIGGKGEPDKQLRATLCLLTVLYHCFGKDEISSKILNQKLQFWGIKSLSHISNNLKKYKNFLIPKGKAGSSKFSYKITRPGLNEGLKILAGYLKKDVGE